MKYEFIEASMAGTYYTRCDILETHENHYVIGYIDSFLGDYVTKTIDKKEVTEVTDD